MQKGPGARADPLSSARQEGAVPQPGWSPQQTPPSQGSAQQDFKQPRQQTGHSCDFFLKLSRVLFMQLVLPELMLFELSHLVEEN